MKQNTGLFVDGYRYKNCVSYLTLWKLLHHRYHYLQHLFRMGSHAQNWLRWGLRSQNFPFWSNNVRPREQLSVQLIQFFFTVAVVSLIGHVMETTSGLYVCINRLNRGFPLDSLWKFFGPRFLMRLKTVHLKQLDRKVHLHQSFLDLRKI